MLKRNKKGFTMVEIVVSIGIMSIITLIAMMFFVSNYKSYRHIKNDSELQFQTQYILNFISNKVMESRKIEVVRIGGATSVINSMREFSISKICLLYNEQNDNCYIFELRNNKIYYGNAKSDDLATVELGTFVSELKAAPYPEGQTFAHASALKITLILTKGNQVLETYQIIYMRNS